MDEDGHAGDNGIGGDVAARIDGMHNIKSCFGLFPFAVIVVVDMDEARDHGQVWRRSNRLLRC